MNNTNHSECATTATSTSVTITATTTKGNGSSSNFSSNVINISIAVATITTSIDKSDKYYWNENNKNRYNLRFIDKLDSSHSHVVNMQIIYLFCYLKLWIMYIF